MKFLLNIIVILFLFTTVYAENNLKFFIDAAFKNNLELECRTKKSKINQRKYKYFKK